MKRGRVKIAYANLDTLLRAGLCLLAVVLLYAPVAVTVFAAQPAACCTSGHCAIPGHHHAPPQPNAPAAAECGQNSALLTPCSLQCCENQENSFGRALVFVLPPPALAAVSLPSEPASPAIANSHIAPSYDPLSPPPRSFSASS